MIDDFKKITVDRETLKMNIQQYNLTQLKVEKIILIFLISVLILVIPRNLILGNNGELDPDVYLNINVIIGIALFLISLIFYLGIRVRNIYANKLPHLKNTILCPKCKGYMERDSEFFICLKCRIKISNENNEISDVIESNYKKIYKCNNKQWKWLKLRLLVVSSLYLFIIYLSLLLNSLGMYIVIIMQGLVIFHTFKRAFRENKLKPLSKMNVRDINNRDIEINYNPSANIPLATMFLFAVMAYGLFFQTYFYVVGQFLYQVIFALVFMGIISWIGHYIFIRIKKYEGKNPTDILCPKCFMVMEKNDECTTYSCNVCNIEILDMNRKYVNILEMKDPNNLHFSRKNLNQLKDLVKYWKIFSLVLICVILIYGGYVILSRNYEDHFAILLFLIGIFVITYYSAIKNTEKHINKAPVIEI